MDLGRLGLALDPETGRRRLAWGLVAVLFHSWHQYVLVLLPKTLADVIDGLKDACRPFGGLSHRLVIDNLAPANREGRSLRFRPPTDLPRVGSHRGFFIDAARPADPPGKPVVERSVPHVRENLFHGGHWLDSAHRPAGGSSKGSSEGASRNERSASTRPASPSVQKAA